MYFKFKKKLAKQLSDAQVRDVFFVSLHDNSILKNVQALPTQLLAILTDHKITYSSFYSLLYWTI